MGKNLRKEGRGDESWCRALFAFLFLIQWVRWLSMRDAANTLGTASHLKQTYPVTCQGIGDTGTGGGRDRVFMIKEAQPARQSSPWPPSSDHIEMIV